MTNRTFAITRRATPVTQARTPRGTRFRFALSEEAAVRITIERATVGRRRGRGCVKATRRNRSARKCTRYVRAGALTRAGKVGNNSVAFSGRIGRKALKLGRYRALFDATDAAGNKARRRTIGFRVVRPERGRRKR